MNRKKKKPIKPYSYEEALKMEKHREREHRKTAQGRFDSRMVSLDAILDAPSEKSGIKKYIMTDFGRGAKRTYANADYQTADARMGFDERRERKAKVERKKALDRARKRVKRSNPKLLPVFDLIVKNGNYRQESIVELARRGIGREGQ